MYNAFYSLNEPPFRLTPDPRFVHLAGPHRDVVRGVVEGILLRKGFILVTGPIGTGKTTLLHVAMQFFSNPSFAKTPINTAFVVNPTLTRDEFLETLLDEFEVPCTSTSKPRRLLALHHMLLNTQQRGGTSVLIVDEAHLLTVELFEEIRLLSNTDSYREKLLQVVLAGQPEMTAVLNCPELSALRQRIASRCHLRALSSSETRAYVAERLRAAGLHGPSPFAGPAIEEIHRFTSGVPRLINLVCESCLVNGFMTNRHEIGLDMVEEAAISLGLERSDNLEQPVTSSSSAIPTLKPTRSAKDVPVDAFGQKRANFLE